MRTLRITRGGQVSIPASVRHRWATSRVAVEDNGDHVVIRPLADDPIAALQGAFAGHNGPSTDVMRAEVRAQEAEAEARRSGAA